MSTPTPTPTMVEPSREPVYRVLSGRCAGQLVPESDTVECDSAFDGCDGAGTISVRFEWRGWPQDGERDCHVCGGVGRVLGYPEWGEPCRLERVEDTPAESQRRGASLTLRADGPVITSAKE